MFLQNDRLVLRGRKARSGWRLGIPLIVAHADLDNIPQPHIQLALLPTVKENLQTS